MALESIFGTSPVMTTGNTQTGSQQAASALPAFAELKTVGANKELAVVNGGLINARTPDGVNIDGQVAIELGMAPTDEIDITIDTTDMQNDGIVSLFDAKDFHKNACDAHCPGTAQGSGTASSNLAIIYLNGNPECQEYSSLLNDLCNNVYKITSVRVTDETASGNAVMNIPIRVARRNLKGDMSRRGFNVGNHVNTSANINNIIDVTLMGFFSRLDGYTKWDLSLKKGRRYNFRFGVALQHQY